MRRLFALVAAVACAVATLFVPAPVSSAPAVDAPNDGTPSDVYAFGAARHLGANRRALAQDVVGLAATPSGKGYWLVARDGGIFAFGRAGFFGSTGSLRLEQPIVGMAAAPAGRGYWLVARDGGIFAFGRSRFHGSTGAIRLNQPVVGMAATPSGRGYWLVARDGGIFAFGDARFHGSTGAIRLHQPVVGMAATPSGRGYWLVARDGGIFAFGDARFRGSTGAIRLDHPVVGMAASKSGRGYWLVARDGGIFAFGNARYYGSMPGAGYASTPIVAMAATPTGNGYWMASRVPLPAARFRAAARPIDAALAARLQPTSWRAGCPVPLEDLRYLTTRHWGFDRRPHTGELVVHEDAVNAMLGALRGMWDARFAVRRMRLVDDYGGSDDASMDADNTSAFNCRNVAGTSRWSEHAYGRAIDINPVENPYVAGSHVSPAAGRAFLDRSPRRPGVVRAGDAVVRAFARVGWGWGGDFSSAKDYQHFSASGR